MEQIQIVCPHCGTTLESQPEWAGMETNCPVCNQKLILPGSSDHSAGDNQNLETSDNSIIPQKLDGSAAFPIGEENKNKSPESENKEVSSVDGHGTSESNKLERHFSWLTFFISLLAITFLGWVYVWLQGIPLLYLNFIFAPIYGLIAGMLGEMSGRKWIAIPFGLFAVYIQWVWSINHFTDQFILNPFLLWKAIVDFSAVRKISIVNGLGISGKPQQLSRFFVCIGWLAESLAIMYGAVSSLFPSKKNNKEIEVRS